MGEVTVTQEMLAAKYGSIFPHLDERQRRLLLGAEARALGHGGIRLVARAAGVREATVSLGVDELESGAEPLGRARRQGGGRKPLADTDPGLVPALLALVEADERGDPMTPLRWTTKSTRNLAGELTTAGHPVSADTVDSVDAKKKEQVGQYAQKAGSGGRRATRSGSATMTSPMRTWGR